MSKTIPKHEARWIGFSHSVTHSPDSEVYIFRKDEWVEIKEYHAEKYEKKAKKNDTWEYRVTETVPLETVHMARFLGKVGKDVIKYSLADRDEHDNPKKGTERKYVFKKEIWIELNQKDVKRFADKAAANVEWEYQKERVPIGTKPSLLGKVKVAKKEVQKEPPKKVEEEVTA